MRSVIYRARLRYLLRILGWSALSGVVVILLAYLLNYPLAKYNISVSAESLLHRVLFDKFRSQDPHGKLKILG